MPNVQKTVSMGLRKLPMVRIRIDDREDMSPQGVAVSLNGKAYLIKPGHEVIIPEPLLEILDHAVEAKPNINPDTRRIDGWHQVKRFPYTVIRDRPQPAEAA